MNKFLSFIFLIICIHVHAQDEMVLSLQIRTLQQDEPGIVKLTNEKPRNNTQTKQKVFLDSKGSFRTENQTGASSYFDFTNKVIVTSNKDTLYSKLPLHYIIHYRNAEYQNRIFLSEALSKSGVAGGFGGMGNLESIFGIESKDHKVRNNLKEEKKKGDTVTYVLDSIPVVKIHYQKKELPAAYTEAFSKYLTYELEIHPVIKEKIMQQKKLPDYIQYSYSNITYTMVNTIKLEGVKKQRTTSRPEDSKLVWKVRKENKLTSLLDSMTHVVATQKIPQPDSAAIFARVRKLSESNNNLSAMLNIFEYLLQSGIIPRDKIALVGAKKDTDTTLQKFLYALAAPASEEEAMTKINVVEELITLNVDHGYILNIFLANKKASRDQGKAFENFLITLQHNPFITGVYKDLGDIYADLYNHGDAWQCYDIALKLNPEHSMVKQIENLKKKLEQDFPEYFAKN